MPNLDPRVQAELRELTSPRRFEADDDKRVAMLSLVPRRKERRVVKGEAPAEVAAEPAVQKAGNE
jgi:hypothetical protein